MKLKHVILNALLTLLFINVQAQESNRVADTLQEGGKMYAVIAIVLVILAGIFIFLFRIEKQVQKLEEELKK
jgi:predicted histidine transporter YuiF (NhaC family)